MTEQATAHLNGSEISAVDPFLGRVVNERYRVLERLGEGGMGVVYVAEHLSLSKKVALKVIHAHWAKNTELILRFKREALTTAQLDHPHIASATDFGTLDDGSAFMVMPWVRGQSLQRVLDTQGKLDIQRVARLGAQIADALSAAHVVGIVHRDLKPDNVLVEMRGDGSESVKVLDFGIARLLTPGDGFSPDVAQPLTRVGSVLGTPGYMAPEQASGAEVDHRADLYALGVILWEACQGASLFTGADISSIFAVQFREPAPALTLGSSAAARELSDLVQRLLHLDKAQRPERAADVRDILRRVASASPSVDFAASATMVAPVQALGRALSRVSMATTQLSRLEPIRRAPVALRWAGAMLLLVLCVSFVAFGSDDTGVESTSEGSAIATEAEDDEQPNSKGDARAGLSLDEAEKVLFAGKARDSSRRSAARTIAKQKADAPAYLVLASDLELASRCSEKKDIVLKMRENADARLLPMLERLEAMPKRGCGMVRLNDCLACVRRELSETIRSLRDG